MNGTLTTSRFVVRAKEVFLVSCHTFGCGKVHFRSTIITIYHTWKQTCLACCSRSAAVLTKFLYSQPLLLRDYRLLHVWNNLMLLCRLVNGFMNLVADGGGFEINCTSGVLPVFKNTYNCFLISLTRITFYLSSVRSANTFIIGRWNKNLFSLQLFCNLWRTSPRKT